VKDRPLSRGPLFLGAVLLSRLALLVAVSFLVRGREFADDVWRHLTMIGAPLNPLLGRVVEEVSMYPPLMGILETVIASPLLLFLPEFYAIRLTFIFYELVAAAFFWMALKRLAPGAWIPLATWVLLPMGWITSAVMAQDEVIAAAFMGLCLYLISLGRWTPALVVCGFGVVAGKIFLLVPLTALVVVGKGMRLPGRALAGFAPVILTFGWMYLATYLRGGHAPLVDFAPGSGCGINLWASILKNSAVTPDVARRWSSVMALAAAMIPLAIFRWRRLPAEPRQVALLLTAMLMSVFALFYHVNPEYYLMTIPALLLAYGSTSWLLVAAVALTVPWVVNFFYGVRNALVGDHLVEGKGAFARVYQSVFSADPVVMHDWSLWVSIAATLGMAVAVTYRLGSLPRGGDDDTTSDRSERIGDSILADSP